MKFRFESYDHIRVQVLLYCTFFPSSPNTVDLIGKPFPFIYLFYVHKVNSVRG